MLITQRRMELERRERELSRFLADQKPKVEDLMRALEKAKRRDRPS